MSTSCLICCGESKNNTIYCARYQYDGYPEYVGKVLKNKRNTYKKALEISKNGNFFELNEDGEPNRKDTFYNDGESYKIKYCTPNRLVDIIINSSEFFEIEFIYYFSEQSNEWICFDSSGRRVRNENYQRRVKTIKQNKLETGVKRYESLSNSDVDLIMDNLREQNTSNKLDSGNFRLSEALNLFQKLLDEKEKGYPYNSDLDVFRKFKKAGYDSARDLVNEIAGAINRRIRELTQVKNDLEDLKQIAISFDMKPGHI